MKNFVYTYNGNRCSFTEKGIAYLKTKDEFKKVFDKLVDVNEVWKDVVKSRPKSKFSDIKEEDKGGDK